MDNTNTQPDHQSKAEWKAPELQRLDINTETRIALLLLMATGARVLRPDPVGVPHPVCKAERLRP